MAFWYRRSSLIAHLTYRFKITPFKPPIPMIHHNHQSCKLITSTWNNININQPIRATKVSSFSLLNVNRSSHFRCSGSPGYRCYHVMRRFKRSKPPIISSLIVLGIAVTIWTGNVEMVRFAIYKSSFLMSAYAETVIGESQFRMMKAEFEGKVLPETHPDRVRVTNILNRVLQVTTMFKKSLKRNERAKRERAKWMKLPISYMEMMKWEVLVVEDDDAAFACCLPGGKIVVFTGLFKHLTTDDEIATIICHEVAHAVMRHVHDRLAMNLWHAYGRQIFYMVARPDLDPREVFCMLGLPFSARMETEVHNMELMLMALAGYDFRVAPKVFEGMGQVAAFRDYLSIHPRGELRSKMLCEDGKATSKNEGAKGGEVDT